MAKKKVIKEDKEDEDFEDDDMTESHYPEMGKKEKSSTKESTPKGELEPEEYIEEEGEEEFEFELEEEAKFPDYKYLNLTIQQGLTKNDYKLIIEGQSHGFCNILVKHLLDIDGVNLASYKVTKIYPPEVFVRIEDGYKIKDVVSKGIDSLKVEVKQVQESFKKLM